MANDIVSSKEHQSLFERLKRFDPNGCEFWTGRDLMSALGYAKWQRFEDAIDRAKVSCDVFGSVPDEHFIHLPGAVSNDGRFGDDYKLTKKGAYFVCESADKRKHKASVAYDYFSTASGLESRSFVVRPELVFHDLLTHTFGWLTPIIPQHPVLGYRLDFYLPDFNLVIEYDEPHHAGTKKYDEIREAAIKKHLKCVLIRVEQGKEPHGLGEISRLIFLRFSSKEIGKN